MIELIHLPLISGYSAKYFNATRVLLLFHNVLSFFTLLLSSLLFDTYWQRSTSSSWFSVRDMVVWNQTHGYQLNGCLRSIPTVFRLFLWCGSRSANYTRGATCNSPAWELRSIPWESTRYGFLAPNLSQFRFSLLRAILVCNFTFSFLLHLIRKWQLASVDKSCSC